LNNNDLPRNTQPIATQEWGGEMGQLVRAKDWSGTPLGPMATWSSSLSTAVSLILGSRFPMILLWGRELVQIYNDGYMQIMGAKHPAGLGMGNAECWPEVWDFNEPIFERVFKGEVVYLEDQEYVLRPHGYAESIYLTLCYSPVRDESGCVGGALVTLIDTTKRLKAERENARLLERSQTRQQELLRLFRQAPGFLAVLKGPDHVFELANDAYYQLVGHREILGMPVREALPEVAGQGFFELLDGVYSRREPFRGRSLRLLIQREVGAPLEECFVDFVYQPVIEDDGSVSGIVAQGHDVTAQVRAIQAMEGANRFKDQFIATLSHELRNPLAPISNSVQILRLKQLPADSARVVEIIDRQTKHLQHLVNDLLDVSRISAGKIDLQRQTVLVGEVISLALEQSTPLIVAGEHQIHLQIPEEPIELDADPVRLSQVISNLLNNAAKYTPHGGNIWLEARKAGANAIIKVRDDGIGMDAVFAEQAFEFFTQEAGGGSAHGGLGLGLALVKTLVELHGGKVSLMSAGRGRGTEVTVSLPALIA
jgi:signal transduction histidine kinase